MFHCKEIGDWFSGNKSIQEVVIGDEVTSIGYNAFYGCSGLTKVTFHCAEIGNWFSENNSIQEVVIGDEVTSIGSSAFYRCSGLTSVTIPNSVTSIGWSAFRGCSGLTSVTIPNSVTSIGGCAFRGCSGLTSIVVESGNTVYDSRDNCNAIVKTSSNELIFGCQNTTIPNSVTSIYNAFYGCSGLTSITIPNSVTSIGDEAFYGTGWYNAQPDGILYLDNWLLGYKGAKPTGELLINDRTKGIAGDAFTGCSGLTSVTIPNSVTSIGESAFYGCSGLTSVVIGSGVTSIGNNAFYGTNLKKTIWLTNTPPSGYYSSSKMNYVSSDQFNISNKVVYKFLSSYFEVDGIRYVPVSPSERTCDAIDCVYDETAANTNIPSTVTYNGITLSVQKVQPYTCYANKYIQTLNWDFNNEIPDYTFYGCSNMKSMTLGNSITNIGDYAFYGCSSLLSVKIPDATTILNHYLFAGCESLSQIVIPKTLKAIKDYVFQGCTGVKELTIADREDELKLGNNGSFPLFADCPLESVYIGGDITYNTSKDNGYSPFYRNTTLKTVEITDRETEISDYEFYGCTSLQSFTVGDGVKKFGDWAFSGCSSLKSLSFGSHLETIGKEAFSDCSSVTKIQSKTAVPPACGSQAMDDFNKWTCTLYVPNGCKAAYQAADQWKEFFYIEEGTWGGDDPYNPDNKKCATPTINYENGKLTFSCATSGAICQSTITDEDIRSYSKDEVQLSVTYHISVYATKEGYENSDVANATLCWIDVEPRTEGIANGVASVRANAVLIQGESGTFNISGADEGLPIIIYNTAGQTVGSGKTTAETTHVFTSLRKGEIGIVKIGQKAVKVMMK